MPLAPTCAIIPHRIRAYAGSTWSSGMLSEKDTTLGTVSLCMRSCKNCTKRIVRLTWRVSEHASKIVQYALGRPSKSERGLGIEMRLECAFDAGIAFWGVSVSDDFELSSCGGAEGLSF